MNAIDPQVEHAPAVSFDAEPGHYRHWRLSVAGQVATLTMDVDEDGGLVPGYKLKLNSYDLGVDIELFDALNRIRFEHPQVQGVIVTSGKERVFCAGANIAMLGLSTHAWKVNFCKFTNETRNGIEDTSRYEGIRFIAALNGTTAGGGYELALACDELVLVDDRSSAVSLPEVPLLGVLPGTGGLTRLTDKRRVRRDHADIFCTTSEGIRGQRAVDWKLVDRIAKPAQFKDVIEQRAQAMVDQADQGDAGPRRDPDLKGIQLRPLTRRIDDAGLHYDTVDVLIDRDARTAAITVRAPVADPAPTAAAALALGDQWYPLKLARELDDAILRLRTNELTIGTWILKTAGEARHVLAQDAFLAANADHWFVRATIGYLRRTLNRLEVSSRSLFAIIEPGTCFAGTLFELALAADRSYMLDLGTPGAPDAPRIVLSEANFGLYATLTGQTRLRDRFHMDAAYTARLESHAGSPLAAAQALEVGLVTATPDDIDWDDEVRIAIEERASLSPDALTGMEANLRFGGAETMETKIFGRLTAWQNWIFIRPNAVGKAGALKVYGTGNKAKFDSERV
jgi:benzoyl-CoA-dihydrodiol lyase